MSNPQKVQSDWNLLFAKVGSYIRVFNAHQTNITRAGTGWSDLLKNAATNFTNDEDARARLKEISAFLQTDIDNSKARKTSIKSSIRNLILNDIQAFINSESTTQLSDSFDEYGFNTQTGILKDLQKSMRNNTATSQSVLQNTVSYAIPTSDPSNTITGTTTAMVTNISLSEMAQTQRVALTCVDETTGQEELQIKGFLTGSESVNAQIDTNTHAYKAGLTFKIVRPIIRNNDGSNMIANLTTNRGESSANMDTLNANFLRLHVVIWQNHQGSNEVRCYSASDEIMHTNLATNLVMIGLGAGGAGFSAGTITLVESNSSGLSGSVLINTNITTADTNISFDLRRFRLNDRFFIDTTRSVEGLYQGFFTKELGIALPSATNGDKTISEVYAGG